MSENLIPVPGRLKNVAVGGHIAGANDIIDDNLNETQDVINNNTYRKSETYSKTELNNLITTPDQEYVSVTATDQTTAVEDVLPVTGAADTIYRVGNWDGTQYDDTVYSEYAWDGTQYKFLSKKQPGIDDKPTSESDNLVKSGGIFNSLVDESKEHNSIISSIIDSPDFNIVSLLCSYIQDKYIFDNGALVPSEGFRVAVCAVTKGYYILSGKIFGEYHANYVIASDSSLSNVLSVTNIDKSANDEAIIYIPYDSAYIAWDEYPSATTTIRKLYDCSQKIETFLKYIDVFGYYAHNAEVVDRSKNFIYNGVVTPTEYNLVITKEIPVKIGIITLRRPSNVTWSQSCGYRFLGSDGSSVVSYGVLSGSEQEISINVPNGSYSFQFSEAASFIEDVEITYLANVSINDVREDVDKKLTSVIYNGGNLPTTCFISNGSVVNDIQYNLYTSNLIDISSANNIKLICSNGVFMSVCGWRFLAEDRQTVVWMGNNIDGVSSFSVVVPSNAKYFQFSDAKDVVLHTTIVGDVTKLSSVDYQNKIDFSPKMKKFSFQAENITLSTQGTSVEILGSRVPCRDWLSAVTFSGQQIDITFLYGFVYGKSSIRITTTDIIEKDDSHNYSMSHPHGLTLGEHVSFILTIKNDKASILLLTNNSKYETDLTYFYGTNGLYATNNSANSVKIERVTIDSTATANADVLLCGDSYAYEAWGVESNHVNKYGWTSLLKHKGCKFGNIGFAGAKSGEVFDELEYLLTSGARPSIIIWGLGMNDGTDTSDTTGNAYYKQYIDKACAMANSIGAIFIPCTIPSVPDINNDGKNYYVRNNFDRYIDFDNALTNKTPHELDGSNWITGYLSSDNVHPTANGFFAMTTQAIKDAPELFSY